MEEGSAPVCRGHGCAQAAGTQGRRAGLWGHFRTRRAMVCGPICGSCEPWASHLAGLTRAQVRVLRVGAAGGLSATGSGWVGSSARA